MHPILGFHCGVGGNRTGIGDYMRRLDAAGLPFAICSVADAGLVAEACTYTNAEHVIVFRMNHDYAGRELDVPQRDGDRYTETGLQYAARYVASLPNEILNNRARVWIALFNECNQTMSEALSRLVLDAAEAMNGWGYRVVVHNWATGTPDVPAYSGDAHLELLRYCAANRGRCAYGLHEYSLADALGTGYPWLVGRWRMVDTARVQAGIGAITYVVKEFGWRDDRLPAPDAAISQLDALYRADESPHIARMIWATGPAWHGTINDDTQRLIGPVTDFVLANDYAVDTPPGPEPPPVSSQHPTQPPAEIGQWDPYTYALAARIYADGLRVSSEEWSADGWHYQQAMAADGTRCIYGVEAGKWDDVQVVWPQPEPHEIVDLIGRLPVHATLRYATRQYPLTHLVVHHTTGPGTQTAYSIAQFHVNSRGWPGIGYHYLIDANGVIEQVNRHDTVSYHCGGNNHYSLGVSLKGNFQNVAPPAAQLEALQWLIAKLRRDIPTVRAVLGHRDMPAQETACPGNTYTQWLPGVVEEPGTVDVWEFMTGGATGAQDGRPYMVETLTPDNARAGMERYQAFVDYDVLHITKNSLFERWELRDGMIRLVMDTSPGNMDAGEQTYYQVVGADGQPGGIWCPRYMRVGQTWAEPQPHRVTFRRTRDCAEFGSSYSGISTNETTLISASADLIEIGRVGGEVHAFRRGYGRVGWSSPWGSARLSTDDPGTHANEIVYPPCWRA